MPDRRPDSSPNAAFVRAHLELTTDMSRAVAQLTRTLADVELATHDFFEALAAGDTKRQIEAIKRFSATGGQLPARYAQFAAAMTKMGEALAHAGKSVSSSRVN